MKKTVLFGLLMILSVSASSQQQYTCSYSNPPTCSGTCPSGQACSYKLYLTHPGGYCACVATTSTTTTLMPCTLNPKSNTCEGYCPNNLLCIDYYGKCTCQAPTTTLKPSQTTTSLKQSPTTTLPLQTTSTIKATTTTQKQTTTIQTTSTTMFTAGDVITRLTLTTLVSDNPTTIEYSNFPQIPFKNRDRVGHSMNVVDLDGIRLVKLKLGGKTVKTCYPTNAQTYSCTYDGNPLSARTMLVVEVTDSMGNVETLDGSIDVQDTSGDTPGCSGDCTCLTSDQASMMFGPSRQQCSTATCGTMEPGGGGTVVDGGTGGSPIPMYCYRPGPTCPGGCSCLTPAQAALGAPGGLSYRPCGCAPTPCGTGTTCYEIGCRKVKGDVRPFRDEHVPYVMILATHTSSGREVPIPAGPANATPEDPHIVYQGCLGEGDWQLTPIYTDMRLCDGCPLQGSWIPPSVTLNIHDLCAGDITQDFMYDRVDFTTPVINITTDPATIFYFTEADVTYTASDASGIRTMTLFESGYDTECNYVDERRVADCCLSGGAVESCVYTNSSFMNYSTVVYRVSACDMAGNVNSTSINKKVLVNESHYKIGTLCSCREGVSFHALLKHWDDVAVGNVHPSGLDEIIHAKKDDGRMIVHDLGGTVLANFTTLFTQYDHLLVGDVSGDDMDEIIIANNEDGNAYIYDGSGGFIANYNIDFNTHDGFAVGDVMGGGKEELLVASIDDGLVHIYDASGALLRDVTLPSGFNGVRYLGDNDRHDGFTVADVIGDGHKEIIFIESSNDRLTVYDTLMHEKMMVNLDRYTPYDGLTVADVVGDEKQEFLVGVDDDGAVFVYDLTGLLKVMYFPFTKYDGLAAGRLLGGEYDDYIVAIDEDDTIYIEYGGDAPVGGGI
ncbi:MAG: hypothetical protein ABIH11_09105 [Candidatus Altiarchaeota archaeon]